MKNKVNNFNKEAKNVWSFISFLLDLTVPVLLVVSAYKETGIVRQALIIAAAIVGANALVKAYILIRKK